MSTSIMAHQPDYVKSDIRENMEKGDKLAILVVHFGTSHADARKNSLDIFTQEVKNAYPDIEVREAYSSRIVLRILKKRGMKRLNPEEMLMQLYIEGYTHVVVQTTAIIHGKELASLRHDIFRMKRFYKEIRLGKPLLYSVEDAKKTVKILSANRSKDMIYIFGGHGTDHPITATYAMFDYMLKDEGHNNMFVATIEGYPEFGDVVNKIKKSGLGKNICLLPFMFVAGEHAKNDLQDDWANDLKKQGFKVTTKLKGLGEYPEIRKLLLEHLDFAFNYKSINISDKKKKYSKKG